MWANIDMERGPHVCRSCSVNHKVNTDTPTNSYPESSDYGPRFIYGKIKFVASPSLTKHSSTQQ